MKYRSGIYYSAEQKDLMWDRWQAGDSLLKVRLWPKADLQNLIVEAVPVSAPERPLLAESGRSSH